jgi:uncharacterized membrane protein YjfL (UPF0719 family)
MDLFDSIKGAQLVATIVYALVGLGFFALSYLVVEKITPFSIRKEIEEDQNTALGIIVGSMMLGLALILAAAIL